LKESMVNNIECQIVSKETNQAANYLELDYYLSKNNKK